MIPLPILFGEMIKHDSTKNEQAEPAIHKAGNLQAEPIHIVSLGAYPLISPNPQSLLKQGGVHKLAS